MATDKNSVKTAAKLAANAHSNLNLFASIEALLEGGLLYGNSDASAGVTARKILKLCKAETSKQLVLYDKYLDAAVRAGGRGQ